MKRRTYGRSPAPRAVRRPGVPVDHLVLLPASLLPCKDRWERLAAQLPTGEALLVAPTGDTPLRRMLRALAPHLRARGRRVTALPTAHRGPCREHR